MEKMITRPAFQYTASILSILGISVLCYLAITFIGYKAVGLVLLVMVSILAMLFDIWPVLIAALLSALILNFFFIPPRFTFHINESEDVLMFAMYFLVAMVNAVLTNKIKVQEKKARDREDKEKTIRLYNTLFNSLSHELKTPISTIIGATDALNGKQSVIPQDVRSALLHEIETAGHRLDRQVENLLNMSRLETGMLKLKKDWCDIHELIYMAIHKLEPQSQHRVIYDARSSQPFFKLDPGLMEQVIYNILQNAIQYTPEDMPIHVTVMHDDEFVMIHIVDNGPGFPGEDIHKIFNKFYRLPDSKTGGIGLGLSIAQGFTEAHGGSLTVKNRPSGGAAFTIKIPAEASFLNFINNE